MKKGFTLIELLVVIGILAILTAAVVVVLNPAELLRQSRDAQRLSDLDSVRSAISLTLATASTIPTLGTTAQCTEGIVSGFAGGTCSENASTTVAGTGWVYINLTGATGGSPLSALPIDPVNSGFDSGGFAYGYKGDETNKTFELNTVLESTKYVGRKTSDGGDNDDYYEVGTDPGLNL